MRTPTAALPFLIYCLVFPGASVTSSAESTNLVANGSFELASVKPGTPDYWAAAGNSAVQQQLLLDTGRDGRPCAKLVCREFSGDGPDYHAMICQVGRIGLRRDQWYRLVFWAKGEDIKGGAVEVVLVNMRPWDNAGLADAFLTSPRWERFEFLFHARTDLPAAASRLQFWFKSTGTLWLDDVELTESAEGSQWFPQLSTDGFTNYVPNSSFECGGANWGSYTYGLSGWAGNLYRLEGEPDTTISYHGKASLKIALRPERLPVFYFDYYRPVRQPVRRVLAANRGWFRAAPGQSLTLSAYLRADRGDVVAQMAVVEAPSKMRRKSVEVGRDWQRCEFSFTPTEPYLFIAVGLDLEASKQEAATLWLDAVQLEQGAEATPYQPRSKVESFIEIGAAGNTFVEGSSGPLITLRAFNDSNREQKLRGNVSLTDFFDEQIAATQLILLIPPHSGRDLTPSGLFPGGQRGFFRVTWAPNPNSDAGPSGAASASAEAQSLRCAVLPPGAGIAHDSPFGFNHAYPWDFLVRLARQAGVVWWRDWSAQWQIVEPESGTFDFRLADEQIRRVQALDSEVAVLLPFPSSSWSTSADLGQVEKAAGNNQYLLERLPVAYAPKNLDDFGRYAAQVVRHYAPARTGRVGTYQILNEPVYTSYALPKQFGYALEDYLDLLKAARRAMKQADPNCRIVGGMGANLEAGLTRDFVAKGGLSLVDVLDLHMYNPARKAESYVESFRSLSDPMPSHGGPKPVWITEWGCYADDDPPCLPQTVGDATMNRCRWPSERAATEHIVKFTAISMAYGVRKIFFHAGTCGPVNGPDAGGVLFEYGGTPRKMLAGVAAFTALLKVPEALVRKVEREDLWAYVFQVDRTQAVAVVWAGPGHRKTLLLPPRVRVHDLMGNRLDHPGRVTIEETPRYLVADKVDPIRAALEMNYDL